jgi:uncharacterized protein DUF4189
MRGVFVLLTFLLAFPVQAAKQSATPNRFGAIAYHRATQSWGTSYDNARERDASVAALRQCGQPQCEVVHKFKNGCAALADGPKIQAAASGATRDEAETKALRRCGEKNGGKSCAPIAWACTK